LAVLTAIQAKIMRIQASLRGFSKIQCSLRKIRENNFFHIYEKAIFVVYSERRLAFSVSGGGGNGECGGFEDNFCCLQAFLYCCFDCDLFALVARSPLQRDLPFLMA
jgi:hypothetical protein